MEYFDVVDEAGNPTGKIIERSIAHRDGILHKTSHVWILRKRENKIEVLLQKRSHNKDSYPNCYDISAAGHVLMNSDYKQTAIKELKEELGYLANADDFIDCGIRRINYQAVFNNQIFKDNEIEQIYALYINDDFDFILQQEEVSEIKWMDFYECYDAVVNNSFKHCIFIEELDMVKKHFL